MNNNQFTKYLLDTHDICGAFWAPETIESGHYYYKIPATDEYRDCVMVLHRNCKAFENRISGEIKDAWLTGETFGPIADKCYDLLSKMEDLNPWQVELKEKFKEINLEHKLQEAKHELQEANQKVANLQKSVDNERIDQIKKTYPQVFRITAVPSKENHMPHTV